MRSGEGKEIFLSERTNTDRVARGGGTAIAIGRILRADFCLLPKDGEKILRYRVTTYRPSCSGALSRVRSRNGGWKSHTNFGSKTSARPCTSKEELGTKPGAPLITSTPGTSRRGRARTVGRDGGRQKRKGHANEVRHPHAELVLLSECKMVDGRG